MPSSVIKAWRYDSEGAVLTITFVSGRAYAYQAVPADVAEGFRLAFAKGEYFNRAIRDRYPAIRTVEPEQLPLL
ncbi:MAG: KTSC domain-containing protein [Caulobacter sp.]|nr:KTSC domain-containing protein [Caulobacter sp.]